MSFLDALLAGIKNVAIAGTAVTVTGPAPTLNFVSGATAVYNATTDAFDVTITASGGGSAPTGVDVKGADAAHFYVGSISGFSGAGGTIPVAAKTLQFTNAQSSPGIAIQTVGSDVTATPLIIGGQPAFSNSATHPPGDVEVALGHFTNGAGGGYAGLAVSDGGTRFFRMDNGTAGAPLAMSMWFGASAVTPSAANWSLTYDPTGAVSGGAAVELAGPSTTGSGVQVDVDGYVNISAGTGGSHPVVAILAETGVNNSAVRIGIDASSGANWFVQAVALTGNRHVLGIGSLSNSMLTSTNIPNGDGVTLFYNATSNPSTSPVGGALLYAISGQLWVMPGDGSNTPFEITSGGGGGTITWANDLVGSSSTHQWVAALSGQGGSTNAIPLRAGAYVSVTDGNPVISNGTTTYVSTGGAGSSLELNGGTAGGVNVSVNGTRILAVRSSYVQITAAANSLYFANNADNFVQFFSTVSGAGSNLWIVGQQSTGAAGGNVNARVYAPGSGSTEAYFQVMRNAGGTDTMQFAMGQATGTISGIWGHGISPSSSNYGIGMSASNLLLNAPTTSVIMSIANATFGTFAAGASDFLSMGGTPASTGYLRLSGTSGAPATLIATSNHLNSLAISVVSINSSDTLFIGDGTNGASTEVNCGSGFSVFLAVASVTVIQAAGALITLNQICNFNAASGTTTSATAGANGDVPAQVVGYIKVQVGGSAMRVPYYNP